MRARAARCRKWCAGATLVGASAPHRPTPIPRTIGANMLVSQIAMAPPNWTRASATEGASPSSRPPGRRNVGHARMAGSRVNSAAITPPIASACTARASARR